MQLKKPCHQNIFNIFDTLAFSMTQLMICTYEMVMSVQYGHNILVVYETFYLYSGCIQDYLFIFHRCMSSLTMDI